MCKKLNNVEAVCHVSRVRYLAGVFGLGDRFQLGSGEVQREDLTYIAY